MMTTEQLKALKVGSTVRYYGFDHKVISVGDDYFITEGRTSINSSTERRRIFSLDRLGNVGRGNTHRLEPALVKRYVNVYSHGRVGNGHSTVEVAKEMATAEYASSPLEGRLELTFEDNKLVGANVLDISS